MWFVITAKFPGIGWYSYHRENWRQVRALLRFLRKFPPATEIQRVRRFARRALGARILPVPISGAAKV